MKIALYHNLPSGGARRATYAMVRGLARRGVVIDEYCPQGADDDFLSFAAFMNARRILPYRRKGPLQRRIPLLTPYLNAWRVGRDLAALARLGRETAAAIDDGEYDLVFSHDCRIARNPDLLRFLKTPSLHYCHHGARGMLRGAEKARQGTAVGRMKQLFYAVARIVPRWLVERRARENIRQATRVLVNSHFARESLFRSYGVDSTVCYYGTDSKLFRPTGRKRQPFFLSVGAVHYHKGYRFLLRALGRLPDAERLPLVIAANSAEREEQDVIEKLACEHNIDLEIRQVKDDATMRDLYNRAALFLYTPIMEPWGLAAVEAMACGTPVVAVREGGLRESVVDGETAILVEREEERFAGAVADLLADPERRANLGRQATAHVRRAWTWARTVKRLHDVMAETAVRGRR